MAAPKHDLLHRLKRLRRFTDDEQIDALAAQLAFVPHTIARLGFPRLVGLAIDWTMFDAVLPSGLRMRYRVLRVAVPRKGRALPSCSRPMAGTARRPKEARTSRSRTRF